MLKGAVLITCFNRREYTLRFLRKVSEQISSDCYNLEIYLVDAGTDGTDDAVKANFPGVSLIQGSGDLYWCGGMRKAWAEAQLGNYDFYLWANDDVDLADDAIGNLIACYQSLVDMGESVGAVTGTMLDPLTKSACYGGRNSISKCRRLKFSPPVYALNTPVECDTINGNLVLVPASSVSVIGTLSEVYTHSLGDFDYGFRLNGEGLKTWVAPGYHGACLTNSKDGTWRDTTLSIKDRLSLLKRPNLMDPENEILYFVRKYGGRTWPLLWVKIWLQWRFPFLWLLK